MRDDSQCELHNREVRYQKALEEDREPAEEDILTRSETLKLGFCRTPNAFRCSKTDCPYHVG